MDQIQEKYQYNEKDTSKITVLHEIEDLVPSSHRIQSS